MAAGNLLFQCIECDIGLSANKPSRCSARRVLQHAMAEQTRQILVRFSPRNLRGSQDYFGIVPNPDVADKAPRRHLIELNSLENKTL